MSDSIGRIIAERDEIRGQAEALREQLVAAEARAGLGRVVAVEWGREPE